MNRVIQALVVLIFAGFLLSSSDKAVPVVKQSVEVSIHTEQEIISTERVASVSVLRQDLASDYDICLIALVVMAEAEGESEEGQRLVIDTILNRLDSEQFPSTVKEVVYQPSQFTCTTNGRIDRVTVTDEMCELVEEELRSRTNTDVLYFSANGYSDYGTPLFQVGGHYFSKA